MQLFFFKVVHLNSHHPDRPPASRTSVWGHNFNTFENTGDSAAFSMWKKITLANAKHQCFVTIHVHRQFTASLKEQRWVTLLCLCRSSSCCKSVCYTHCFIFSRPWNVVYQTQQVSRNATISHFHHRPPFNLASMICPATAHSVLLFPLIFFWPPPRTSRREAFASVSAISDPHWKWQVNFAQLLPFSVPLSSDAPVPSHSVAACL